MLKLQANNMDISELSSYSYDECKDLFSQIKYCIDDKNMVNALSQIIEKKKIEKYPELLKPTYYPEIDSLNIPDAEKIRLDKAARWNAKCYIKKHNIEYLAYPLAIEKYPLSIEDLELLNSIGIVEKKYDFRCKNCDASCGVISESDLKKYKRYWKLLELKEQNTITDEQLNELNLLGKDGFYGIYLYCIGEEDKCEDIEITNEKELSDYMQNVEVVYRIVKEPDLAYEKL